jgi:hypothetical protein
MVGGCGQFLNSGARRRRLCTWKVVVGRPSILLGNSWAWGLGYCGGLLASPRVLGGVISFDVLEQSERMPQVSFELRK